MVTERGSILAGVLGISIVMAMAAGSLLIVASNSANDEDRAFLRARCYLDAESGLMTGVAWLRNNQNPDSKTVIETNQTWTANTKILLTDVLFENNSLVTVTLTDHSSYKTVTAKAVQGSEMAQFSWDVGIDVTPPAGTNTAPKLSLKDWRSP